MKFLFRESRKDSDSNLPREKLALYVPKSFVRFFRKRYLEKKDRYLSLEKNLVSARMPFSVPKYLAVSIFYPLVMLPVFFFVSYIIAGYVGFVYATHTGRISPTIQGDINFLSNLQLGSYIQKPDVAVVETMTLILLTVILFYTARKVILLYPAIVKSQRKSKIDSSLPHVVNIMLGMSKGGSSLLEIIRTIAEETTITGEVGREFAVIFRDVEVFHKDIISAMRYVATTTPSTKLSEFLEDLIGIVEGGGKLSEFLEFKSTHYLEEKERFHEIFVNSLEIMAEVYVAIFVVAPLFILIVLVVMGMMGQEIQLLSKLIVYLYMPVGGVMFIWLIRSMVMEETSGWLAGKFIPVFVKARIIKNGRNPLFRRKEGAAVVLHKVINNIKSILSIDFILRNPEYTILLTLPAAVIVAAYLYLSFNLRVESLLGTIYLIAILPYVIFYEYRSYMLRKFENDLPEFLKQLGSLNESGLTIVNALKVLSTTDLGSLTREVRNIRKDIEWGKLITEAFHRFDERIGSPVVSKVVSILVKALESTDNVKAAIFTAANDAEIYLDFRKRVASEMFVYTVIVYVTFSVFLFTIVVLNQNFISVFGNISTSTNLPGTYFTFPSPQLLTGLFYHATLINGFFSGIVAGVMGSGSMRAGLKHSLTMVVATVLAFKFFLGVGF